MRAIQREAESLNGWWHVWFDEATDWQTEEPFLPGTPLAQLPLHMPSLSWQQIEFHKESLPVPGTWAQTRPGYHGVAWHWRPVIIPPAWEGRALRLRFEAVRLRAEVYWDEHLVGYDLEGHTPFEVELTDHARPGRRYELAVRVTNPGGSLTGQDLAPLRWGEKELPPSYDVGGIWGNVTLLGTPLASIEALAALPHPDLHAVTLRAALHNRAAPRSAQLTAQVLDPDGRPVAEAMIEPLLLRADTTEHVSLDLVISAPRPWSPEHPALYTARVTLVSGDAEDQQNIMFGLRHLAAHDGHLMLNGKPFLLHAARTWGWYPGNLLFPSANLAEREVQAARVLGLNALQTCRQEATPALLEAADRAGLLLVQGIGGLPQAEQDDFPTTAAQAFRLALAQTRLRRVLRRDLNHPCIVGWSLAEEPNAVPPSSASAGLPSYARGLRDLVRAEDPTRLLIGQDRSGTWAETLWEENRLRIVSAPLSPAEAHATLYIPTIEAPATLPDLPEIVRRYGDRVLPGSDAERWQGWLRHMQRDFAQAGMQRTFGSLSAFCRATRAPATEALSRLILAQRRNPACAGLLLDPWAGRRLPDCAGLVDPFRRPQADTASLRRANAPLTLWIEGWPTQVATGHPLTVALWALNDSGPQAGLTLNLTVSGPDGQPVVTQAAEVSLPETAPQAQLGALTWRAENEGRWLLQASLSHGDQVLAELQCPCWVVRLPTAPHPLHLLDPAEQLVSWWQGAKAYRPGEPVQGLLLIGSPPASLQTALRAMQAEGGRIAWLLTEPQDWAAGIRLWDERLGAVTPLAMADARQGSWVYSHAHPLLEGVTPPGLWGTPQAELWPSFLIGDLPGDILIGGVSCARSTAWEPPEWGAALSLVTWGQAELLLCTLPLIRGLRRSVPATARMVDHIARWLASG